MKINAKKDKLTIELYSYKFDIYFDISKNSEEEKQKIQEEILKLEVSIERRKKLLSNSNNISILFSVRYKNRITRNNYIIIYIVSTKCIFNRQYRNRYKVL